MRVLYICTGNSFRSPVAEALTRKHHSIEVESAGTDATDHIAGNAEEMLAERGALQYVKPSPDQVSREAVKRAERIVGMMPMHAEHLKQEFDIRETVEVWNIRDPITPAIEPREAFERIEEKVESLRADI